MARRRLPLGLLGPVIVIVGAAVAAIGVWYIVTAKPKAGAEIETVKVDDHTTIVIRAEDGGDRSFVELHERDDVRWQALIPHYAGRPGASGVAWSPVAVSVRVTREGRAEVFALSMHDAAKLGGLRLAKEHEPIQSQPEGPVTLTDHIRSYEIVGGRDWHQLIAISLLTGVGLWKVELGPTAITDGAVEGGIVWVQQGARKRRFMVFTGRETWSDQL
jgi:hypothetical protein